MTEAMPFLQKAILLSYDPRPLARGLFCRYARAVSPQASAAENRLCKALPSQ